VHSRPLVSVVTPVYNAAMYLPETCESVRAQTYAPFEHIIVDDCSHDGSRSLITKLAEQDRRVRPVFLEANYGPVIARNRGTQEANGKYLAFVDADDLWHPEKLERQIALMEHSKAALSFTDYRHMSADGSRVGFRVKGPRHISLAMHYRTRFFCCSSVMINRALVPDFSFPSIAPAVRAEDFIAWATILRTHGSAVRCDGDLVRYRLVKQSRSSSKLRAVKSVWYLYRSVEHMSVGAALLNFSCFAVSASIKHAWAWPRLARSAIDGRAGSAARP
jgi:teichuronic acid biosynthesis glycosyltransferase TuaG